MLRGTTYPFPLQVLEQTPSQGPAAARNHALSVVDAPVVLFLDDDVIPGERLIEVHAAHHAQNAQLVVIGTLLAPRSRQLPWIRWEADTLLKQYEEMQAGAWLPTPRQFYTGNASVRREHVEAAGGFDQRFARGEDVDLAFRLQQRGLQFVFEPSAAGIHIARRSFRSWVTAAKEYGNVETTMGPVWGSRSLVDVKVREFQRRNKVVRRAVIFALTYPRTARALIAAGRVVGSVLAAVGLWRLSRGAYTAIFELAYWRGVEQAIGVKGGALERIASTPKVGDSGLASARADR
jgi:hypothetical protein